MRSRHVTLLTNYLFPPVHARECMSPARIQRFDLHTSTGTYHCWMNRGSMKCQVCLTHLHMATIGNRTLASFILRQMTYPLGHMSHDNIDVHTF